MSALRALPRLAPAVRAYSTAVSAPAGTPVRVKKPASIKSGVAGFIVGTVVSGYAAWQYVASEYNVQSEALRRDVEALREAVGRVDVYCRSVQSELEELRKGRK